MLAIHARSVNRSEGSQPMPVPRISLMAGKPPADLTAVADSLDRAPIESFEVAEGDRFAAFHQHARGELIVDRAHGGGPRSDDLIVFHVVAGWPRSAQTKAGFFKRRVETLAAAPGLHPEDVMVTIVDAALDDGSFARGLSAAAPRDGTGR